jgi:hypothetical protein
MPELVFWTYLVNAALLINHEIDSAYWREWNLFRSRASATDEEDRRDLTLFLLFHLPVVAVFLWGLIEVRGLTLAGLILSLVLSGSGIAAFVIHVVFIRKGHREFVIPISLAILGATLIVSMVQAGATIALLIQDPLGPGGAA